MLPSSSISSLNGQISSFNASDTPVESAVNDNFRDYVKANLDVLIENYIEAKKNAGQSSYKSDGFDNSLNQEPIELIAEDITSDFQHVSSAKYQDIFDTILNYAEGQSLDQILSFVDVRYKASLSPNA
ncbi:MAG: hypothetical protein AAF228_07995 [Pseudomonadota bacterium]